MSAAASEPPRNRRTTYGDDPSVHETPTFVTAMRQLVPDERHRAYFVRDGILRDLIPAVYRHATNPVDGPVGRSSWIGRDALLITEDGYTNVSAMLVFAHYEVGALGVEIWLDDARPGLEAYEEEDDS